MSNADNLDIVNDIEIVGTFFVNEMCNVAANAARSKGGDQYTLYTGYRQRFLEVMNPENVDLNDSSDRSVYMTNLIEFIRAFKKNNQITLDMMLDFIARYILPPTYYEALEARRDAVVQSIIYEYCRKLDLLCEKLRDPILAGVQEKNSNYIDVIVFMQNKSHAIFYDIRSRYLNACMQAESKIVGRGNGDVGDNRPTGHMPKAPMKGKSRKQVTFDDRGMNANANTKSPSERILKSAKRTSNSGSASPRTIVLPTSEPMIPPMPQLSVPPRTSKFQTSTFTSKSAFLTDNEPDNSLSLEMENVASKKEIKLLRQQVTALTIICDEFDSKFLEQQELIETLMNELATINKKISPMPMASLSLSSSIQDIPAPVNGGNNKPEEVETLDITGLDSDAEDMSFSNEESDDESENNAHADEEKVEPVVQSNESAANDDGDIVSFSKPSGRNSRKRG